jgi:hypothetical protein
MTLIKSLLLGSAATFAVVAAAQAADLPTKKGAPAAEYVRICNVGGVAGFVIPGTDTCLKITGGIEAMAGFGNLDHRYTPDGAGYLTFSENPRKYDNSMGFDSRADVGLETRSNTAYGPLVGVIDIHWDQGFGFGIAGANWSYINEAYIQWAGVTAGIKPSFYDFIAGGETWFNIISPEHSGTGIPLFAYTATFGGGFSATVSLEQNSTSGGRSAIQVGPETFSWYGAQTYLGTRAPDIVGSLDLTQSWGTAHLAGVAHNYRVEDYYGNYDTDGWGWGVLGGISFNLPMLGAGDVVKLQGAYSDRAIGYSGMTTSGWDYSQGLNMNGNGYLYALADAVGDGFNNWSYPTTWEFAADAEFHLTPQFAIDPEISYGNITWSNRSAFGPFWALEGDAYSWLGGAVFSYTPVTNLSFNLELVYQYTHWDAPANALAAYYYPAGSASGFNGRVRVERDF